MITIFGLCEQGEEVGGRKEEKVGQKGNCSSEPSARAKRAVEEKGGSCMPKVEMRALPLKILMVSWTLYDKGMG